MPAKRDNSGRTPGADSLMSDDSGSARSLDEIVWQSIGKNTLEHLVAYIANMPRNIFENGIECELEMPATAVQPLTSQSRPSVLQFMKP